MKNGSFPRHCGLFMPPLFPFLLTGIDFISDIQLDMDMSTVIFIYFYFLWHIKMAGFRMALMQK